MKPRLIAIALLFFCAAAFAPAQSLKENQFFKKSVELRTMADQAFEEGDYDAASEYASQATDYAKLSNAFVEKSIIKLDANRALGQAEGRIAWAFSIDAPNLYPELYTDALAQQAAARELYSNEDFFGAREGARGVIATCEKIAVTEADDAIAEASDLDSYLVEVGAPESFARDYAKAKAELAASLDAYGREDWATSTARARASTAVSEIIVLTDAEAVISRAFDDLAWARSIGAADQYPATFAGASDELSAALDAMSAGNGRAAAESARASLISTMEIAREDAIAAIDKAAVGLAWAEGVLAPIEYPTEYASAKVSLEDANGAYARQAWRVASERARASLASIVEIARAEAAKAIAAAKKASAYADSIDAKTAYAEDYALAAAAIDEADKAFNEESFALAGERAGDALVWLEAIAWADAKEAIAKAQRSLEYADQINASQTYPTKYGPGKADLDNAVVAFDGENWSLAASRARSAFAALDGIAREDAAQGIAMAKDARDYAEKIDGRDVYAEDFEAGSAALAEADGAFGSGNWGLAAASARDALFAFEAIAWADAKGAIEAAQGSLEYADQINASKTYPAEYGQGKSDLDEAVAAFAGETWSLASSRARSAFSTLDGIARADAAQAIAKAKDARDYAERIDGMEAYAEDFAAGSAALTEADGAFGSGNWGLAAASARDALFAFEAIAWADAKGAIETAQGSQAYAVAIDAENRYFEDYENGKAMLDEAVSAFEGEDWSTAAYKARGAYFVFDDIARADASGAIATAVEAQAYADSLGAQELYAEDYEAGSGAIAEAGDAFAQNDWSLTVAKARDALLAFEAIAWADAKEAIALAQESADYAVSIEANLDYPEAYASGKKALDEAKEGFSAEVWGFAAERARKALLLLDGLALADAERAIDQAEEWIVWAEGIEAPKNFPAEYGKSRATLDEAEAYLNQGEWRLAAARAKDAIAALDGVQAVEPPPPPPPKDVYPATYTVRLIPERRDCLWRIAEYPWVYNDPLKWPLLYEANKKTFRDPANPNLIFPGQVLVIPPLKGELRSGSYDPKKKDYPTLPKTPKPLKSK